MRKTTKTVATVGAVLSGVSGVLLTIYIDDAKKFLDDLLSRLFGIPKSMVGYNVVTVVVIVLLGYAIFLAFFFLTTWIANRFGPQKRPDRATDDTTLQALCLAACLIRSSQLYQREDGNRWLFQTHFLSETDVGA
jgi:hypothetical protein